MGLITVKEAAARLGVSAGRVRQYMSREDGRLPAQYVGGSGQGQRRGHIAMIRESDLKRVSNLHNVWPKGKKRKPARERE